MSRMSIPLLVLAGAAAAQEQPVPVDQGPHHHVVLKNDYVEVMHVILAPGERTLYHIHAHDRAAVELNSSSITQQKVGEAEAPARSTQPGDLSAATLPPGGYSHRVHNAGTRVFEVLDVEFLRRPEKPSQVAAAPVARRIRTEIDPTVQGEIH